MVMEQDLPSVEELRQAYIEYVLERVKGNRSRAARILGIDRRTLYRWLPAKRAA
jgi:two-component system response regulator AtoC